MVPLAVRGYEHMTHDQHTLSRRRFVQTTAASSLALAGMGLGRDALAQTAKPNIIFILADDLGYADVSCYGQRDYTTPNVDRLAVEGLRFMQAYANSSVCSATRTGLITGRYQYRLPVGLEEPINATTPKDVGPAAKPSDAAVAVEEGRLPHQPGRQVAPRLPAGFRPAQERLRPFFRHTRRRRGLFQSRCRRFAQWARGRPALRRGGAGRTPWLHDQSARRPGGRDHRGICEVEGAVPTQPAFHGAALALGGSRRRSRIEANTEPFPPRWRHAKNLRHD